MMPVSQASRGGGGGGGGTPIFHIYVGLAHYLGLKILNVYIGV